MVLISGSGGMPSENLAGKFGFLSRKGFKFVCIFLYPKFQLSRRDRSHRPVRVFSRERFLFKIVLIHLHILVHEVQLARRDHNWKTLSPYFALVGKGD